MIGIIKALVDRGTPYKHEPLNVVLVSVLLMILIFVVGFVFIV